MLNGFYEITIGTVAHSPKDQTSPSSELAWQAALHDAKTAGRIPQCQCMGDSDNPLVIRHHQGSREYYGLARYPKKGHTHHPKCRFYADKPELSGMQGYTTKVVEELDDGMFKIKLELDRQARELGAPAGGGSTSGKTGAPLPRKRAMRLLGLLHFLFTQGQLNRWHPSIKGKRSWPVVVRVLLEEADRVVCGRASLSEQLLLGIKVDFNKKDVDTEPKASRVEQEAYARDNRARIQALNVNNVKAAQANKHRLVAIGRLSQYDWMTESEQKPLPDLLKFTEYDGLPFMTMDKDMWGLAEKHYPSAWSAWRRGGSVYAIVRLQYFEEPWFPGAEKMKKDWKVVDIALQSFSADSFIPVESSHENRVIEMLVTEDRIFEKPLRFEAGEDEVFPDFILLDTEKAKYPMEVFGLTTEAYEKREGEKRRYYEEHFRSAWWCWKVASSENIPPLPAKAKRAGN
jgi:hypothetical protein